MKHGLKMSALFLTAVMTTNCGGSGGGGGGDREDGEDVSIEASQLAAVEMSLRESGNDPVWNFRLIVAENERLKLDGASFADLQDALTSVKLKSYDAGRLEMTALGGSKVLATNLEEVAYSDDAIKKTWDSECKKIVNPNFNLKDAKVVDQGGKKYAQINLGLCDFAGMWLVPTVSVQSQRRDESKQSVVYKCKFNIESVYSSDMTQYADVLCEYGYDSLPGETAPNIAVPVEYAPDSEFYEAHRLKMDSFDLNKLSNGRRYDLTTDFAALPFGSHAGCSQQKVDLFYSDSGVVKQTRANYKRHHATNGDVLWVLENESELPNFDNVLEYYRGAAANSRTITVYRFCEWSPATMADASGDTMRL